ncbi:MAG: cobalt-precorrin-5B (C(1))-methyltransferase CbiD [Lachnospiraceae bacterium]|nr:cobalt-precorrin-5B (C(1))-methyltransferase CbiD [Lachnospiraceae bacterium]
MRSGFTTGSCAAAAAKAACLMIFEKSRIESISIMTPAGVSYHAETEDARFDQNGARASCAVRKDSGDDPDVTDGMLIYAEVSLEDDGKRCVIIEGGEGIGTVTRPGLDRSVGEAAINSVPRRMIEDEVRAITEEYEYGGTVRVVISAPEGRRIAQKTFNQRFGIEGGISIIGTTGVVEPMSTKAVLDTIALELRQHRSVGEKEIFVSPGNYGLTFMKEHFGYDLDKAVKCSNYIGKTIDIASSLGFERMLLIGHAGKLVKLSGGIMNTHSSEGDCRMELMAAAAARSGAAPDVINRILSCISTDEAYGCMKEAGIEKKSFSYIMERIMYYLNKRSPDMKIDCIVFSNRYGVLGSTVDIKEGIS